MIMVKFKQLEFRATTIQLKANTRKFEVRLYYCVVLDTKELLSSLNLILHPRNAQ